jgi:hypothetical protein
MKYRECRSDFLKEKEAERKVISCLLNMVAEVILPVIEVRM